MTGENRRPLRAVPVALFAVLLIAWGLLLAVPAHAASNFIIEDYDIEMQVSEDDTYLITETIDVHFTASSHGIYRVIPYKTTLDRDGQLDTFYGRVRDFRMLSGDKVSEEKGEDAYYFRIGDPNKYAAEDTTYQFSYVFDMRGDHLRGADEVYYNLVGTSWEAKSIEKVHFRVTFPKAIDPANVGVKTGDQLDVPFEAEGDRVITCSTSENTLGGLTIRAVLPQGYFTKEASRSGLLLFILSAILICAAAWGFLAWRRYGRDPEIVETEEFYPPEGLSAPEVGYLDAGEISGEHITSLLLTLADKGYLQINETEGKKGILKHKSSYDIIQLKEYDGESEDEEIFMDGLFEAGDFVQMDQLKNSFYKTVNEIRDAIKERYEERLFDKKANRFGLALRIIGFLGMVALFVISKIINGSPFIVGNGDFITYIVIDIFTVALPLIGFFGITSWINKPKKNAGKFVLGFIGWALMILVGLGLALLFDTIMTGQFIPYLIGMGMIFVLFLLGALCERRTDEYTELLGKIRGYKRFLQLAEKDRMEMLAEQDPGYYYRNLAFAFALGVTAVYAKRFAEMAKEPPQWYTGPGIYTGSGGAFDSVSLMDSVNGMMKSVSSTMTSSPSDSGGGGSFSGGGGAGGGGGGSW